MARNPSALEASKAGKEEEKPRRKKLRMPESIHERRTKYVHPKVSAGNATERSQHSLKYRLYGGD